MTELTRLMDNLENPSSFTNRQESLSQQISNTFGTHGNNTFGANNTFGNSRYNYISPISRVSNPNVILNPNSVSTESNPIIPRFTPNLPSQSNLSNQQSLSTNVNQHNFVPPPQFFRR